MSKSNAPESGWRHTPEHLRINLMDSLKALKADKIDMVCLFSQSPIDNEMSDSGRPLESFR